jgi:hypothetical protein
MKPWKTLRCRLEHVYFSLACFVSLCVSAGLLFLLSVFVMKLGWHSSYILIFLLPSLLAILSRSGHIRANSVRLHEEQFPEIYLMVQDLAQRLDLPTAPEIYMMQTGGALTSLVLHSRSGAVVVSASLLEHAFTEEHREAIRFLLAQEVSKIALGHAAKMKWVTLSSRIPFLGSAYARACTRSSDAVAATLVPKGAVAGIQLLAAGHRLSSRMNTEAYLEQRQYTKTVWVWLAERLTPKPFGPERIRAVMGIVADAP